MTDQRGRKLNAYLSAPPASIGNGGIRFPNGMCFRAPTKYAAVRTDATGRHAAVATSGRIHNHNHATILQLCAVPSTTYQKQHFSATTSWIKCVYRLLLRLLTLPWPLPFLSSLTHLARVKGGGIISHPETPTSPCYALVCCAQMPL